MYLVLLIDAPFHIKLTLPIVNKTTFVCEKCCNVYSVRGHVLVATHHVLLTPANVHKVEYDALGDSHCGCKLLEVHFRLVC